MSAADLELGTVVLWFLIAFVIAWPVYSYLMKMKAIKRTIGVDRAASKRKLPLLFRLTEPVLIFLLPVAEGIKALEWRTRTEQRLRSAGLFGLVHPHEILALKILLTILLSGIFILYAPILTWWWAGSLWMKQPRFCRRAAQLTF